MKVKIIEDPDLTEDLVIYTKKITPRIEQFVQSLNTMNIIAQHRGSDLNIPIEDILFFETEDDAVVVHLKKDYYRTRYKLYELLELLPESFMRISKSCIVNVDSVSGYECSITSSRTVFFVDSHKSNFVSRMYFSDFKARLLERSLSL